MHYRTGSQIREDFLRFFEGKGHRRVHSSSLVPHNDPTLLFTNAGMNQFKDVFLGADQRPYSRAATSQKCVRAGGKHNDLENVGFTRRHHTFFEMLGNFSFGDYFKREAIAYAWELLTSDADHCFAIDPARLYVTIFAGDASVPRDDEAERLWIETGVPRERIFAMPAKDNFWQMGETGPCGPCSEIFYDLGIEASERVGPDGHKVDKSFPEDEQRYVEIWNLVFMQFDRTLSPDGPVLTPLPKPSIDTGMGLERIACVLQQKLSNFETDLFVPLTYAAQVVTIQGTTLPITDREVSASYRVIADHSRAATFLIADGVLPSNEGRGYVLRKIIRRAISHGMRLGTEKPFFYKMVPVVVSEMQAGYENLIQAAKTVERVILAEEDRFAHSLALGFSEMNKEFDEARNTQEILAGILGSPSEYTEEEVAEAESKWTNKPELTGEAAFSLYETYGLPIDFMVDAARDAGIELNLDKFQIVKEAEQARARASWRGGSQKSANPLYTELQKTEFEGYAALRLDGARVLALTRNGEGTPALAPGEEGEVILDATSFYADSGGQQGDIGYLLGADHHTPVAEVRGATKPVQGVFAHKVVALQPIALGDTLDTAVDAANRHATERNHTGTHLLHAALRQVLGTHVKQAGSLNNATRLRFDFSHFAPVGDAELQEIEDIVNREVLANAHVETLVDVPIDEAVRDLGAMALFGEKYGDRVRVVRIGSFSTELCGGTHTRATGEIGLLKLTGESSVSSGIRRIEALSGTGSLAAFRRDRAVAEAAAHLTGGSDAPAEALSAKLAAQDEELKKLRRDLDQARMKSAAASTAEAAPVEVQGVKLLAQRVTGLDKTQMRALVDTLRTKLGSGVVVLGAVTAEGKVSLIAGVTKDLTGRVQAGRLISTLAPMVGGKGGGRPDLAEAGGSEPGALDAALTKTPEVLAGLLG